MKSTSQRSPRLSLKSARLRRGPTVAPKRAPRSRANVPALARAALLDHFAPAAVVVDERGRVVFQHGRLTAYVRPVPDRPLLGLLQAVRPRFRAAVAEVLALFKGASSGSPQPAVVLAPGLRGAPVRIAGTALAAGAAGRHCLITFSPFLASAGLGAADPVGDAEPTRLMLEGIRDYAICRIEPDGALASWPSGAAQIFGYTAAEAKGRHLHELLTPEDRRGGIAESALAAAAAQGSVLIERWHERKDGSRFWATGILSRLQDPHGAVIGFVNVIRDSTDRKRADDALREAIRQAEAANASKDHFLANVSHELRTPMSATLLWAKLLSDQKAMDPELLREGLAAINRSVKEQQVLIEDLMDTAKIVAGKMRLEPRRFDLNQLIQTLLPSIRSQAVENRLVIDETLDAEVGVVEADPRRLQQVVSNLLNNALKFTPAGGRISVVTRRDEDKVQIQVIDTGKGISREFLNRIFERFVQVEHGTTPTASGMGLGLAIARQLIELHGGTIRAESSGRDQGSAFQIELPLPRQPAMADEDHAQDDGEVSLAGWRVLLVEDSAQTRQALAAVLVESGADVTAVGSEHEALEAYQISVPDVILSDLGLGTNSGHQLIAEIRKRETDGGRPPVPAMALTAYADDKNRRKAFECGFQDCATKPIEPGELLKRLGNLGVKR